MQKETRLVANRIQEVIQAIEDHIERSKFLTQDTDNNKIKFGINASSARISSFHFKDEFIVINKEDFLDLYMIKIQKYLTEIESDFNILNDSNAKEISLKHGLGIFEAKATKWI